MFLEIKNLIDKELITYIRGVSELYKLRKISPVIFKHIKDFISRKGKRVRPILFIIGYLGFSKHKARGLYRSAVSLELLHDFMLVHDDIIDKSEIRRGKPSMHAMLNKFLLPYRDKKFNGADLTIVIGDVMYAMANHAFLAIDVDLKRKENALRLLIDAAMYTGSGEFMELLLGLKSMDKVSKADIYKIYDLKTASYTFSSPLAIGATLAGANPRQIKKLLNYGICLGRAFQIKDDIAGLFGDERKIGKSTLTDLQEAKKTILVWHAYHNSAKKDKAYIKSVLSSKTVRRTQFVKIQKIVSDSGALDYAKEEISSCLAAARSILSASTMKPRYKLLLESFSQQVLNPK